MIRSARLFPLSVALAGLALGSCVDQREGTAGPGSSFFDGETVYAIALVSSAIYRYQNELAERARDIVVNGIGTPIFETGCTGTGRRVITSDSTRVTFNHLPPEDAGGEVFVVDCNSDLRLNLAGEITFEILDSTPGQLHYTMEMPLNLATFEPEGMTYQLPADIGDGAILFVTTPGVTFDPATDPYGFGGYVDCVQNGNRIEQTGTVRIEERQQNLLIVEELEVSFAYDGAASPSFAPWPGGRYQVAALAVQGFGASSSSIPFDVTFDGFGGAVFPLGSRTCTTNLATGDNPCQDL